MWTNSFKSEGSKISRRIVKIRDPVGKEVLVEQCRICQRFFVQSMIAKHRSNCLQSQHFTYSEPDSDQTGGTHHDRDSSVENEPDITQNKDSLNLGTKPALLGPVERCKICLRTFLKEAIGQHLSEIHGSNNNKDLADLARIKRQRKTRAATQKLPPKKIICRFCKNSFPSREEWEAHMAEFGNHGGVFECTVCAVTFQTENGLRAHKNKHLKRFQCQVCNVYSSSASSLKSHMTKHSGLKPFTCSICKKTFPYSTSLSYHMQTHEEKKIICQYCGHKFTFSSNYTKHIEVHHSNPGDKLVCEHCGALFPKRKMKDHLASHAEATLPCEVCGKKFKIKNQLRKHRLKVHKKELRFSTCPVCSVAFSRSESLQSHMAAKHPVVQEPSVSISDTGH